MMKFSEKYVDYLKTFKKLGVRPFKKEKMIRMQLGDYVHINVFRDILFSIMSLSPKTYIPYMYSWGKFVGAKSTEQALDTLDISIFTRALSLSRSLKIMKMDVYKDIITKSWIDLKYIPKVTYVDERGGVFRIQVYESDESYGLPKIGKKVCFYSAGILAGSTETLIRKSVNVVETKCYCDKHKYDEFMGRVGMEFPEYKIHDPKYFKKLKTKVRKTFLSKKKIRPKLGDYSHIASLQVAYLGIFLSSPGSHTMLYWIGKETGAELASKVRGNKLKELEAIMKDMKIGILSIKKNEKNMTLKLKESAFSAGAKNFDKRIDSYLAGLYAGYLTKSLKKRYNVVETKCIASGNPHCEFLATSL